MQEKPTPSSQAVDLKADQLIAETTQQDLLLRRTVALQLEQYGSERIQEFAAAEAELAAVLPKLKTPG